MTFNSLFLTYSSRRSKLGDQRTFPRIVFMSYPAHLSVVKIKLWISIQYTTSFCPTVYVIIKQLNVRASGRYEMLKYLHGLNANT